MLYRRVSSNRARWIEPGVARQGALLLLIYDLRLKHLGRAVAGSIGIRYGTLNEQLGRLQEELSMATSA